MTAETKPVFTDNRSRQIYLLHYVSDQLRQYANESSTSDDVLPAFADILEKLAAELESEPRRRNIKTRQAARPEVH